MLSSDDVYILLCGDLNSRTANEFPISQSENDVFARAVEDTPVRCSEDSVLNSYGKKVIVYRFWLLERKKKVRKLLRKFRKSLDRAESVDYCCARREYKKKNCCSKRERSSMKMC